MDKEKLIQAIKIALSGDWQKSHEIVQDLNCDYSSWIHAVLHKIEGDKFNSNYWYKIAKKPNNNLSPIEELQIILKEINEK